LNISITRSINRYIFHCQYEILVNILDNTVKVI